ncbi:MAG TPA: hypothetical protein VGC88_09690 [Terriglobales bacterium]|jgi:hypothetical protein
MRRLNWIATICIAALPITASAQMRGGGASRGSAARGASRGFAGRAFAGRGFNGGGFNGGTRLGFRTGTGTSVFFGTQFPNRFHHHNFNRPFFSPFGFSGVPFGYPLAYPYMYDYPFGAAYQSLSDQQQTEVAPQQYVQPQPQYDRSDELNRRIDRLTDEIASLRQQQAQPAAMANSLQQPPATTLVFKDHHEEPVQNYAIVGQTLWVFSERTSRKIPLSDLDVTATQQANSARGIQFNVPNR